MGTEIGFSDEERLKRIETGILALRITVRSMLVFLTPSKGDKAYDDVLIGTMRDALVKLTKSWDFGGAVDETERRHDLERSIGELLDPLSKAESRPSVISLPMSCRS